MIWFLIFIFVCYTILIISLSIGFKKVEEFSSNFSITPNPTNDVFTLNTSIEGEAMVQIINSLGQVVATYNNNLEANATYDVSAYEAGVYFVNVTVGNQVATQRLVIE